MKIVRVTWRLRSDFYAIFECEFCQHKFEGDGYDDFYFHNHVIPEKMKCSSCGKSSNSESLVKPCEISGNA